VLNLPVTPADCLAQAIVPALDLLPGKMDSQEARVQLLATAWQETKLRTRHQYGNGPARGLTQYERGGLQCVLSNPLTHVLALQLCEARGVAPTAFDVWNALEFDDVLGFGMCRLTCWADSKPLPALGDANAAWAFYLSAQNPGVPRPKDWPDSYRIALEAVEHG